MDKQIIFTSEELIDLYSSVLEVIANEELWLERLKSDNFKNMETAGKLIEYSETKLQRLNSVLGKI